MAATTAIPVEIAPDAAARIEELGMQRALQTMLEHTKQTVPGLQLIEVTLYHDPYEPGQPRLTLTGWRDGASSSPDDYLPETEWGAWFVRAFPPEVCRWFSFDLLYRDEHGR